MLNGSKSDDDDWNFTEDWPQSWCSYIRHFISSSSRAADVKNNSLGRDIYQPAAGMCACNVHICKLTLIYKIDSSSVFTL